LLPGTRLAALAALAALAVPGTACRRAADPPRPATFDQAKRDAAGRGVPVLIDFAADW
jgi:hypothetical protein